MSLKRDVHLQLNALLTYEWVTSRRVANNVYGKKKCFLSRYAWKRVVTSPIANLTLLRVVHKISTPNPAHCQRQSGSYWFGDTPQFPEQCQA
jgi:hypothetical protein